VTITKRFCDFCGKEAQGRIGSLVLEWVSDGQLKHHAWDICKGCKEKIEFIVTQGEWQEKKG